MHPVTWADGKGSGRGHRYEQGLRGAVRRHGVCGYGPCRDGSWFDSFARLRMKGGQEALSEDRIAVVAHESVELVCIHA